MIVSSRVAMETLAIASGAPLPAMEEISMIKKQYSQLAIKHFLVDVDLLQRLFSQSGRLVGQLEHA